jgi:YD repeat-containing protein
MEPDEAARRREQHRRARELRKLAEKWLREYFAWRALRDRGLATDADSPLRRSDPQQHPRPYCWTYDAQGRLTSITQH